MQYLPLLMTASISTRGMKEAYYTDVEREQMYLDTLTTYIKLILKYPQYKIVFAENSGYDLSKIKNRLPEFDESQLEFISLDPEDFDITKGKGYNELLLINQALQKSRLLVENDGFVKITGRYPIYNVKYFIDKASQYISKGMNMYCDVKDHSIYRLLGLKWNARSFYSVLYGVNKKYYLDSIADRYVELNDYKGYLVEDMLYDVVKDKYLDGRNRYAGVVGGTFKVRFNREPICGGLQGSRMDAWSFSADQNSIKSKLKRLIGNWFRWFLPWVWF